MAARGVVIFTEGPPADWRRAALSLANACPGLTYGDAARACRFSQGFLDLVLAAEQLETAAAALTAAGAPARVLPTSDRVTVPPAFTLLRLGVDDLGLSGLEPKSTAFARVPWRRVRLLHLAWVGPGERARGLPNAVDSGLLGMRPVRAQHEPSSPEEAPELWFELVLLEPFARLRIRMSSFVYDCLRDPAPRSEDNLRRVVELIALRVPKAIRAGLVEACLAGTPLDAEALDDHENDRALSWELTRLGLVSDEAHAAQPQELASEGEARPTLLELTADGMARFRRPLLLGSSVVVAIGARIVLLQQYPTLPARMVWPIQLALWVPSVVVLSVAYMGVQMWVDSLKNRETS